MEVKELTDEHELAAPVFGRTADELRAENLTPGSRRWLLLDGAAAVAAATSMARPDDRVFLRFVGDEAVFGDLAEGAARALDGPVHAATSSSVRRDILESAGFVVENTTESFTVRFDRALASIRRAWSPVGFSMCPADDVDEDRLFDLDNRLRQDVPGTDGWRGNRDWFDAELREDPAFDASGYLVAIHDESDEYVGLIRFWRNPDGPRLGLIGVVREHRGTMVAPALFRQALEAASRWGSEVFFTGTSLTNKVVYPKLSRIGESQGLSWQLVRE